MTRCTGARSRQLARTLLIDMLASIRHSASTPLRFGIDAPRIAGAALRRLGAAVEDGPLLVAAVDGVAREALECPPASEGCEGAGEPDESLAAWLETRHSRLSAIHPLTMDVLRLLVEGESHRDVAEQLDLGSRWTRRIARDARTAFITLEQRSCSSR